MKRYLTIQWLAAFAALAFALPVVTAQDAESDKRAERAERARKERGARQQEPLAPIPIRHEINPAIGR